MATKNKEKTLVVTGNVPDLPDYIPGTDWDDVVTTADAVAGHDLAKDELLDALVSVPFMITRLTYRKGIKRTNGVQAAYVSCETVIAPEHVLKRRRINMAEMPFEPGSQVIFNDGSTGIYRQILAYLSAKGIIEIPEDLPESGAYGETRYDLPPSLWTAVNAGEFLTSDEDDEFAGYEVNVRLTCPRGLRLSEYASDYNPAGSKTRYLA